MYASLRGHPNWPLESEPARSDGVQIAPKHEHRGTGFEHWWPVLLIPPSFISSPPLSKARVKRGGKDGAARRVPARKLALGQLGSVTYTVVYGKRLVYVLEYAVAVPDEQPRG